MSHITLIRHGQANSTAKDELSYDQLSPLGHEQAAWLGDHLRQSETYHTRLYTGTLTRHIETAEGMNTGLEPIRDARLNELEYFTLANLMEQQHKVPFPREGEFVHHLPQVFDYWKAGKLADTPETYESFETRVQSVLAEIAEGEGPALVVTSGGLIGMAMRIVMRLDLTALAHACLAIENTSLHRIQPLPSGLALTQFNALPHLDTPERLFARSHL